VSDGLPLHDVPSNLVPDSEPIGSSAAASNGSTVPRRRFLGFPLIASMVLLFGIFAGIYFPFRGRKEFVASRATVPRRVNPEAQQDYLKAKEFSERWIVDGVKSALIFDDRAIALEPNYAPAFSLRSTLLIRLGEMGVINGEQACSQARADALRAVDLDPRLTSGYVSLAGIQMNRDWDLSTAEATLTTARRMEPNDVSVLSTLSNLLRFRGQLDESIALQRQVITMAPLSGGSYGALAIRLFIVGRLDEALAAQQRALELDPQLEFVHFNRAEVLLAKGLPNDALREVDAEPGQVWRQLGTVVVMHDLGRTNESNSALRKLIATHPAEPYNIASAYAYRGDLDQALAWLDHAFDHRDVSLIQVRTDPLFHNLRGDPRFASFLRRMKT
jgi:tetratricopeptide (TPR) repeat protein